METELQLGLEPPAPRKRGRPRGSGNKRTADFKGWVEALYGGTAAQQQAAFCMVTPRELRAAGGNMGKARVAKALDLVKMVKEADPAAKLDLVGALAMIGDAVDSLMPYTDQRQAQAVDLTSKGERIQAWLVGVPLPPTYTDAPIEGEFEEIQRLSPVPLNQVAPPKSHD